MSSDTERIAYYSKFFKVDKRSFRIDEIEDLPPDREGIPYLPICRSPQLPRIRGHGVLPN